MKLFTTKEVAEILKLSERTIKRRIATDEIKVVHVFNSIRISKEELERITGLKWKED